MTIPSMTIPSMTIPSIHDFAPISLNPLANPFLPRHPIGLNPLANPFVPIGHPIGLNPLANEFLPVRLIKKKYPKLTNPKIQKNNKNKKRKTSFTRHRNLDRAIKDNAFTTNEETQETELNPVHKELLEKQAFEAQFKRIPAITSTDGLEQVAQISFHHQTGVDIVELFWNGTHAILDNRRVAWQFPDMPIRDIIHYYFDEDTSVTISEHSALDDPASYAPAIHLHVYPIFDNELDWGEY
jgi:hypothetical protein